MKKERDLGTMAVLVHVAGDAVNNIGVIIAGVVIWKASSPNRFYIDPAVGIAIAIMILISSIPLGRSPIETLPRWSANSQFSEKERHHPSPKRSERCGSGRRKA